MQRFSSEFVYTELSVSACLSLYRPGRSHDMPCTDSAIVFSVYIEACH